MFSRVKEGFHLINVIGDRRQWRQFEIIPTQNLVAILTRIVRRSKKIKLNKSVVTFENPLEHLLLYVHFELVLNLFSLLDKKDVKSCLDIGANCGQFAIALKCFDSGVDILSIEPNWEIYKLLEDNSRKFIKWRTYCAAVSDRDSQGTLTFVPGRSGQGSENGENATLNLLKTGKGSRTKTIVTRKMTMANILKDTKAEASFDLVKVDVEGSEESVLLGLKGVKFRYLILEINPERIGIRSILDAERLIENIVGNKKRVVCLGKLSGFNNEFHNSDFLFQIVENEL
jgi:FkbM family methyltransferase